MILLTFPAPDKNLHIYLFSSWRYWNWWWGWLAKSSPPFFFYKSPSTIEPFFSDIQWLPAPSELYIEGVCCLVSESVNGSLLRKSAVKYKHVIRLIIRTYRQNYLWIISSCCLTAVYGSWDSNCARLDLHSELVKGYGDNNWCLYDSYKMM